MSLIVHHRALNLDSIWNLHGWQLAWDGNEVWDPAGTVADGFVNFNFPDTPDPRKLTFRFRSLSLPNGKPEWEPEDFNRQIVNPAATEIWTFTGTRRILYQDPNPPGIIFSTGDTLTFNVFTRDRFRGGSIYVWNPYGALSQKSFFAESSRDDVKGVSTFVVQLANWMTQGFHLKLIGPGADDKRVWETDASNRVWRPCDGKFLWLKERAMRRAEPAAGANLAETGSVGARHDAAAIHVAGRCDGESVVHDRSHFDAPAHGLSDAQSRHLRTVDLSPSRV